MATALSVGNALVDAIAAAMYPNGTSNPSIPGVDLKVFMGWPMPGQLDNDMAAGKVNISVYPLPTERNTTRYLPVWQTKVEPVQTISAVLFTDLEVHPTPAVLLTGTISTPQVVSIVIQGQSYVYNVLATDTILTVAYGLAALIGVDYPGTGAEPTSGGGALLSVPLTASLQAARIGATGTAVREQRRQEKQYQITVWANTPANRELVVDAIDQAFAAVRFITASDGSACRLIYHHSLMRDEFQKTMIYRYDYIYTVEYATFETEQQMQVVTPIANIQGNVTVTIP